MMGLGTLWKAVLGAPGIGREPPAVAVRPTAPRPAPPEADWSLGDAEPTDTRSAERFVPNRTATVLTMADGRRVSARIINISRTGVAVETGAAKVSAAEVAMVGTRPVTPGRRIALGMVFLFRKQLDPKLCGPDMVL